MSAPATARPIPAPENFPFEWSDPSLEALFWTWDQMHNPHPLTPLTFTLESRCFCEGSTRGFQAVKMPVQFHAIALNGYNYGHMEFLEPADAFPPAWWPNVEQEFMARLPGLTQTWENEYLPEVQAFNRELRDTGYAALSTDDLLAFFAQARDKRIRMWDLHMQAVIPIMGAASRFAETCAELLGAASKNEGYLMLQGFENLTVESGKALWRLSRAALARPALAKLIAETPVEELASAIRASDPSFWGEVQRYLDQYGWRSDAFELADPAWAEEPRVPLTQLREMLHAPDDADPARTEEHSRKEREELVRDARERLEGNPGKPIFELMLPIAQQYLPIQENHNFYIDQMNTVLLRKPALAIGERLAAANAIAQRDDVFYLTYEELPEAAHKPASRDWAALVEERRADRERWSAVVPPRELGTPPPEGMRNNPISGAFFGEPVEQSKDPKVINGIGASAGTVTGTARIVPSLDQADKLQQGDILVCQMTMPAWTPLFASVSAVVADSGGILSHCAIVAREYRIPCVVGTQIGTQVLKDGQRITVDGAQGIVRIEG
ncbi:MAG: PEP-utilizing enzyme [Dehalococcoidia bacterium]